MAAPCRNAGLFAFERVDSTIQFAGPLIAGAYLHEEFRFFGPRTAFLVQYESVVLGLFHEMPKSLLMGEKKRKVYQRKNVIYQKGISHV